MPDLGYPLAGSVAILCAGGLDAIRKEAWPFYRTISGVRLCWELEEPKTTKERDPKAKCFLCSHFYGRAFLWAELGEIKTYRTLSGLYPGRPRPQRQSRIERSKSLV